MRVWRALACVAMVGACSEAAGDRTAWQETLRADIVAIDREPISSDFTIIFFSTDDDPEAERYQIDSRCVDYGYYDSRHSRFLSGTSPIGTGAEKTPAKQRQDIADGPTRVCTAETPVDFERILRIMQEGANLSKDQTGGARLTTPSGRSIDLSISQSLDI